MVNFGCNLSQFGGQWRPMKSDPQNDAKHTPGPWAVHEPIRSGRAYFRVRGTQLGSRFKIANVFFVHSDYEPAADAERAEAAANARLIAAAPELLATLKELAALMPVCGNDHDISVRVFQVPTGSVRKALAAITNAEGGQQ